MGWYLGSMRRSDGLGLFLIFLHSIIEALGEGCDFVFGVTCQEYRITDTTCREDTRRFIRLGLMFICWKKRISENSWEWAFCEHASARDGNCMMNSVQIEKHLIPHMCK
jgi:hypothetical protein